MIERGRIRERGLAVLQENQGQGYKKSLYSPLHFWFLSKMAFGDAEDRTGLYRAFTVFLSNFFEIVKDKTQAI